MITTGQLRDAIGLKSVDSIQSSLKKLEEEKNKELSYKRGRSTVLERDFFRDFLLKSRTKRIGGFSNKILSFANNKGGSGKTSTCATIGLKFSELGYNTLLIDTDPQANLTKYLLGKNYEPQFSLYDFFKGTCELEDILIKASEGLYVIPSRLDNDFLHEVVSSYALPKSFLNKVINPLKNRFELFLIDTNPTLSDTNLGFHSVTDMVLTIANNDLSSMDGFRNILKKLNDDSYEGTHKLVFNRIDAREKLVMPLQRIESLIESGYTFSIANSQLKIDRAITNAQDNTNGFFNQLEIGAKIQQDSLNLAIELLHEFSDLEEKELH